MKDIVNNGFIYGGINCPGQKDFFNDDDQVVRALLYNWKDFYELQYKSGRTIIKDLPPVAVWAQNQVLN